MSPLGYLAERASITGLQGQRLAGRHDLQQFFATIQGDSENELEKSVAALPASKNTYEQQVAQPHWQADQRNPCCNHKTCKDNISKDPGHSDQWTICS